MMSTPFLLLTWVTVTSILSGYFTWQAAHKRYKQKIAALENEMANNHSEILKLINNNRELESMIESITRHYASIWTMTKQKLTYYNNGRGSCLAKARQ